jgi:uncharacterized protein (DUF305 family)
VTGYILLINIFWGCVVAIAYCRIRDLKAARDQNGANAETFRLAMIAKHQQLVEMTDLGEAHKQAAEIYRVALHEQRRRQGEPPDAFPTH